MPPEKPCKVCRGPEPYIIDKLLLLRRGPRFIAPIFGHTRQAVAAHQDRCLVGERRAKVEADLRRMVAEGQKV